MVSALLCERIALDEMESRLRRRGYTLVRQPSPEQLPGFLRGIRPDAIAVGPAPSLVIEVLPGRGRSADTKVRQLSDLVQGHEDWRLEVVYLSSHGTPLAAIETNDILAALRQSARLADNEPQAGLLMAWAALESITRRREPGLAARSLSSGSLVDLLVSNGHVSQADGTMLTRLGEARNRIAHGQLDVLPDSDEVRCLVALVERLTVEPAGAIG